MARVEVQSRELVEDELSLDPATLDPSKHYRFCREDRIARRRAQGYEVVLADDGPQLINDFSDKSRSDGAISVGGMILMACDNQVYKERRNQVNQVARDRLDSSDKSFLSRAKRSNVRTLTGDEGE